MLQLRARSAAVIWSGDQDGFQGVWGAQVFTAVDDSQNGGPPRYAQGTCPLHLQCSFTPVDHVTHNLYTQPLWFDALKRNQIPTTVAQARKPKELIYEEDRLLEYVAFAC